LIVVLALAVSVGACGDDSGAKSGSGAGGTSGGGNAGSGAGSKITAEQAATGMCDMMGTGMDSCTGGEEYDACVLSKCGVQDCFDGECKGVLDCYKAADVPCEAKCPPSAECQTCITANVSCLVSECYSMLKCSGAPTGGGMTKDGGACDQLDACCETQPEGVQMTCTLAAGVARAAAGDTGCESAKMAFCM
jgi:hypothetical protein